MDITSSTSTPAAQPAAPTQQSAQQCKAPAAESPVKKVLGAIGRYVVPCALSVWLIVVFFKEVNLKAVWHIVQHGCTLWIIGVMMVIVVLSHICRGIRWGIQLRGVGIKRMPPMAECCAIFGAYALNIVFPRLGEAWRCVFVSQRQHCPLMTVVGTDMGDRASDLICVFCFLGIAWLVERSVLIDFVSKYSLGRAIGEVFSHVWLWGGIAFVVISLIILIKFFNRYQWVQKLAQGLKHIWQGFAILFHMPQMGLYLWLTLGIWVCYFLETYVCFYAFPFTEPLIHGPGMAYGLRPGLLCLVFGVCSTIIPSNGGLGPWTIAVAYAVELFGLPKTEATAYALVVWGFEAITLVGLGIYTAFYLMYCKHKNKKIQKAAAA